MATVTFRGAVQFGLLNIPVKVYSAARSESISFKQILRGKDGTVHQVGNKNYDKVTFEDVDRSAMLKGFEISKNEIIEITPAEIEALAPKSSRVIQVLEFVPMNEVDPIYFDASYFVVPDETGQMLYNVFFAAMKNQQVYALAKWTTRNREHLVAMRLYKGGIMMHTLFYEDEVRGIAEYNGLLDESMQSTPLVDMCAMLVKQMSASFEPDKYQDEFRMRVAAMIEAKKANPTATYTDATAQKADPAAALMAQLQASFAAMGLEVPVVPETKPKVMAAGAGAGASADAKKVSHADNAKAAKRKKLDTLMEG